MIGFQIGINFRLINIAFTIKLIGNKCTAEVEIDLEAVCDAELVGKAEIIRNAAGVLLAKTPDETAAGKHVNVEEAVRPVAEKDIAEVGVSQDISIHPIATLVSELLGIIFGVSIGIILDR